MYERRHPVWTKTRWTWMNEKQKKNELLELSMETMHVCSIIIARSSIQADDFLCSSLHLGGVVEITAI
jgi:hypothetical protein